MTKYEQLPMRPELVVCPKCEEKSNAPKGYPIGAPQKERRYKCHECGKTFSDTYGTPLYGLKTPQWVVAIVLTLLAYGCPIPAIVAAFQLDERTVGDWLEKAGRHTKQVQESVVCDGQVALGQVQGDEFYVKTQSGGVWIATAMCLLSPLPLGCGLDGTKYALGDASGRAGEGGSGTKPAAAVGNPTASVGTVRS